MAKRQAEESKGSTSLDDLFQTGQVVQDGDLAAALKGRITLVPGVDRVFLEDAFYGAPVKKRLIAVGLGRHVLVRKGVTTDEELGRPVQWFAEQVQEQPTTVAQELSRLKAKQLFVRTDKGYAIPGWALRKAVSFLLEE